MPRQARLDFEGCLHHVINRGIERRKIFLDQKDYEFFRDALGKLLLECQSKCYGWVLMPNHFHLLVETGEKPLSKLMNRLLTRYAGYFNRKYHRAGRLFQNRYKSIICDKDEYFMELVAYIHLNPLRAGLVSHLEELEKYLWSGHRDLIGLGKNDWYQREYVLSWFGKSLKTAERNYLEYLESKKGIKKDYSGGGLIRSQGGLKVLLRRKPDEREACDSRVLGDGAFVEEILRSSNSERPNPLGHKLGKDVGGLIKQIAAYRGVQPNEIYKAGKSTAKASECRAVVTYLGSKYLEKSISDLSEMMGVNQSSGSKLYHKGEELWNDKKILWLGNLK